MLGCRELRQQACCCSRHAAPSPRRVACVRPRAESGSSGSSNSVASSSSGVASSSNDVASSTLARSATLPAAAHASYDDDLSHECSFYDWKWGSRVSYVRAGRAGPPLLLVHGFGVGSYHFERNIPVLAQHHRVFAIDLLGQGDSWPSQPDCAASGPLRFSADTWTEQLQHFIEQRIGEPVYIAGNSLGGYLAVNLAARHPASVAGLVLLNATPFWSSRPPLGQESLLWRLLRVDGAVPVPQVVKATIQRFWWDTIRQPATIRSLLQLVYARPQAIDDALLERIVAATHRPDALDAFTSILLSPRTALTFDEMLAAVTCPVLLAYGRDDPWVVPIWGQRLKRVLPQAQYLELSPAGHCPHHEAPAAINSIITTWLAAVEAGQHGAHELVQVGATASFTESDGQVVTATCLQGAPRNVFERWDDAKWRLGRAVSRALRPQQQQRGAS